MQQFSKEVLERFDILANKLGTTSEYLWHILVKQGQIHAVELSIGLLLACIGLIVGIRLFLNGIKVRKANKKDEDAGLHLTIPGTLLMVFCTVSIIVISVSLPTLIFNPEYFALEEILKVFGR